MFETFAKRLFHRKNTCKIKKKIKINGAFVALDWAFTTILSHHQQMIPYLESIFIN